MGDLKGIASKFLDDSVNPFYAITKPEEEYLNTLSAIRNYIAHKSDSALVTYKRSLGITYGIKSKPQPDEFLNAVDYRAVSTAKGKPRIIGLLSILNSVVSRI